MYYLRVKEAEGGRYTDGKDTFSIHETSVGVDNAPIEDLIECDNLEIAMSYFKLKYSENENNLS